MASVRPEGSGSMGEGWTPSAELLEDRELLSGLLDGLGNLGGEAPVEEAAVVHGPAVEEPPAVVEPPAEVPASAVATHAPASALAALAADSSTEAPAASPAAPSVSVPVASAASSIGAPAGSEGAPAPSPGAPISAAMVGTAESASTPAPTVGSSHAPARTTESPAAVEHAGVPGAKAVDSLLAKVAVANESYADSTVVDSPRAPAVEPGAGSVSAHGSGRAESRVDRSGSVNCELDCLPTGEDATQPDTTADVSSSGARTAETVEQEVPTVEDNQSEAREAPIERSLVQSAGDQTPSDTSQVGAAHETTRPIHAGEVRIAEQPEAEDQLVSRVSQLFDLVPNWPGVDLDAVEDAARSQVEDGEQLSANVVDVVSTHDVSCWATATATAGTTVGFAIARREPGLPIRDTADGPTDEEVALCWSVT